MNTIINPDAQTHVGPQPHDRKYPKILTHPLRPAMTVNSVVEEEQWVAAGFAPVKIPEHHEYPKALVHPGYVPARMVSAEKHGPPVSSDYPEAALARLHSYVPAIWEPECHPPVIAKDTQDEEKYKAMGYVLPGKSDAAAFSASPPTPEEIIGWPKWLTPPQGEPMLVKSAAEEDALRSKLGLPARKGKKRRTA